MSNNDNAISAETEKMLSNLMASCAYDPVLFAEVAFPWGEKGTPLENFTGLEDWQKRLLNEIKRGLIHNERVRQYNFKIKNGEDVSEFADEETGEIDISKMIKESIECAVVSGHGIGKSSIVAIIILFFMSCSPNIRGVVTASTKDQIYKRTWPDLQKWHNLVINKHWFKVTKDSIFFDQFDDENNKKNYMITAETVSKEKTEAIAGLHNAAGRILIIFDEASGIDDKVWEVIEGAKTDGEVIFLAFGNPTRTDGMFRECFRKNKKFYFTMQIDSRSVSFTDKAQLQKIIDKFGPDSDVAKVRVYGKFPDQAFDGFIKESIFEQCTQNKYYYSPTDAVVLGMDIAGSGEDSTVLYLRSGKNGNIEMLEINQSEPVDIAMICKEFIYRNKPDAIFAENIGPGVAVCEILKMWGINVTMVPVGNKTSNLIYGNVRAEIWSKMLNWMRDGGVLPDDEVLKSEMCSIKYSINDNGKLLLEKKRDMKARGLKSPDHADALALTFYTEIKKTDFMIDRNKVHTYDTSYDVMKF